MFRTLLLAFGLATASFQVCFAEEIKIGVLLPLTGPSSDGGRDMQRGFEIATEMQNEKGGIKGDKIKLIMADAVDVDDEEIAHRNGLIIRFSRLGG